MANENFEMITIERRKTQRPKGNWRDNTDEVVKKIYGNKQE